MARVTNGMLPDNFVPDLTLDRYQEIMRLPINAFNGLNKPDETPVYECSTIWKQDERDGLAIHLGQAEEMRIQELGYYLAPRYDQIDYAFGSPLVLDRKHLIDIGEQKTSDIAIGEALTLGIETAPNDPIVITLATTLTDVSEVYVYYPGEDVEIKPSSKVITGGNLIIKIPRARVIDPDLLDNREDHLSYYENDNFLTTVDIKRVYYDAATGFYYLWEGRQVNCNDLDDLTQVAWHRIRHHRTSIVDHNPGSYSATSGWTSSNWSYRQQPLWCRVRFRSGRQASMLTEIQTARLAHTLMPNKPSSCPTVHQYWQEDILEKTKTYSPYGTRDGALRAWLADSRAKVGQGGKFPSARRFLNTSCY